SALRLELGGVGQQSDGAGLLDRLGQLALEGSRGAGEATRNDLAAVRNKLLQKTNVAVGDRVDLLHGELADLLAAEELASARTATGAAGRARTTRSTGAGTTVAAGTTVRPFPLGTVACGTLALGTIALGTIACGSGSCGCCCILSLVSHFESSFQGPKARGPRARVRAALAPDSRWRRGLMEAISSGPFQGQGPEGQRPEDAL